MNRPTYTPSPRPLPRSLSIAGMLLIVCALAVSAAITASLANPHTHEVTSGWPSPAGWAEYGGSLHRTGYAPVAGPETSQHAPNTPGSSGYSLHDRSFSSPVIDHEGNVYTGDISGRVTKLTPTLEEIWISPPLGDGEIRSSVLVAPDGNVHVAPAANTDDDGNAPKDGDLFALDKETGEIQWRYAVNNIAPGRGNYVLTAAPAYHPDGFILQGSMDGHLYAVSLDGQLLWRFQTHDDIDNKVVSAAAVGDDATIYFGSQNGRFYALTPDGEEKWHFDVDAEASGADEVEQIVAAPSIGADGTIYVGTRHAGEAAGVLYAIRDEGNGPALLWSRVLDEKIVAPTTIRDDGALFVGALDGTFYRIDPDDGSIVWSFYPSNDDPTISNQISGVIGGVSGRSLLTVAEQAVVDAAGQVYVSYWNVDISRGFPPEHSLSSPVYALDTETGDIEWRRIYDNTQRAPAMMPTTTQTDGGMPRGVLYLSGDDGAVRAIGEVRPNPVVLPAPSVPGDTPDAPDESEDDLTTMPADVNETGDETSTGNDDGTEAGTNETESAGDTQQEEETGNDSRQRPRPLFEGEIPMPGGAVFLIALLGMLALHRRRRA